MIQDPPIVPKLKIKASQACLDADDGEDCRKMNGKFTRQVLDRPPFRAGCTCTLVLQRVRTR
jgi:hypothetical protein